MVGIRRHGAKHGIFAIIKNGYITIHARNVEVVSGLRLAVTHVEDEVDCGLVRDVHGPVTIVVFCSKLGSGPCICLLGATTCPCIQIGGSAAFLHFDGDGVDLPSGTQANCHH